MNEKRQSSLFKNTTILGIGTIISKGLLFLMIPFFSSWLSIEEYGSFDLYNTYIILLVTILTLACGEALFRFLVDVELEDKKNVQVFVSSSFVVIVIAFALITTVLIGVTIVKPDILLIVFLIFLMFNIFYVYLLAFLRGIKRLEIYTIANVILMVGISLLVTLFVFIFKMGLIGMLLGYACSYMITCVYIIFITKFFSFVDYRVISFSDLHEMIRYSFPLIPNNLSWWILSASDRLIVRIFLGAFANGIYAMANKVPAICNTLFTVFQISWQQNVAETISDKDRNVYYNDIFNKLLMTALSICIMVLSFNFIIFNYVINSNYFSASFHVPILISSVIFTVMAQYFGGIFIGFKKPHLSGITTIAAAAVNIVCNLILVRYIGLYSASISTLISYSVIFILRLMILKGDIKFKLNPEAYSLLIIYVYFVVTSYYYNFQIQVMNVLLAGVVFIWANRKLVSKLFRRIRGIMAT